MAACKEKFSRQIHTCRGVTRPPRGCGAIDTPKKLGLEAINQANYDAAERGPVQCRPSL